MSSDPVLTRTAVSVVDRQQEWPTLRAQVLAATAKGSEMGWRYVPSSHCGALFALANACHQATSVEDDLRFIAPTGGVG